MAELTHQERLLPSLLDRLTDDDPKKTDESRNQRTTSWRSLRDAVLRDLEQLMNTVNLESSITLDDYPELCSTVINYGIPDLSSINVNDDNQEMLKVLVKNAIVRFEPRIMKDTLRVNLIKGDAQKNPHIVAFQIEGSLWGQPMPEVLFLRTELDLALSEVKVIEL